MIIVEGADNVGKSTLVKQLLELDPTLRLLDRPRFSPKRGETIAKSYIDALQPADGDHVRLAHSIADRFLASECIYGALFRKGCRITANEHLLIRGLLHELSACIVWCDPGDEQILASWHSREQMYPAEHSLAIAQAYRDRINEVFQGFPIIRYNWSSRAAEHMRRTIITHHQNNSTRRLQRHPCAPIKEIR